MERGLIPALAKAAKEAREERGLSPEQIAVALDRGVDKVRRFEKAIPFAGLDDLLNAYSTETGVSLIDLLESAQANLKKQG